MHRASLAALLLLLVLLLSRDGAARHAVAAIFVGDFETGSYAPWNAQCSNTGYADDSTTDFGPISVVKGMGGQGTYAAEFQLPANGAIKQRCQVITSRTVNLGGDDYYSLMFDVPAGGFQPGTSSWGPQIAELDFQNLYNGPTLALAAKADHVTLILRTGRACASANPPIQYNSNADAGGNLPPLYAIPRGELVPGWHELVIHAHWAADSTGRVEIWHRLKGQTGWTKTVDFGGYPTLESSCSGSVPTKTLDVLQAYRGPSYAPLTVYLDGFTRTTSFAAAAAELP